MSAAKVQQIVSPSSDDLIQRIPLTSLHPASWNARKTRDEAAMQQLCDSVREHGVQVPLIVRPILDGDLPRFEIVAGHRRFDAILRVNGVDANAPCIVRDLTDDEARERGLVDNLQREDVPALEEADAYAELKQRLGTSEAIAARVGKDVSYVARRLQLVSLAELPRLALAERLITVDHALLLARLGADEQSVNLKWLLNPNAGMKEAVEETIKYRIKDRDKKDRWTPWEPQSVLELKHHIEEHVGRKLSRAPWSLDDAELVPAAGACSACPSNTKANTTLFSDLNIAAATCENGGCFEAKRAAFVEIRLSKATHDQGATRDEPAIRISFKSTTVKPRVDKKTGAFSLFQIFKDGQWIEAKPKSCEHVRLGVSVDWFEAGYGEKKRDLKPGSILSVCIADKCKAHKKAWEQAASGAGSNAREAEAARKAKRERAEAVAHAESKIRVAAASKALEAVDKLPAEALRDIALHAAPGWGEAPKLFDAVLPGWKKTLQAASVASKEFAKAVALVSLDEIAASEYCGPEHGRQEFLASLKRLGYDGKDAWKALAPKPQAKAAKKTPAKKAVKAAAKKGGRK